MSTRPIKIAATAAALAASAAIGLALATSGSAAETPPGLVRPGGPATVRPADQPRPGGGPVGGAGVAASEPPLATCPACGGPSELPTAVAPGR